MQLRVVFSPPLAARDADPMFYQNRIAYLPIECGYGPYRTSPNVALMKTLICSRVTGSAGQ